MPAIKCIFQAVGFVRVENCPTRAVLPLVGLAADQVIRDRYDRRRPPGRWPMPWT
ncbi:MAG: hypothetical protein ACQESR_02935 [Planctomycetota bacterium]